MLEGKGIWINIISQIDNGDIQNVIKYRVANHFDYAIIKVIRGSYGYNIPDEDLAAELATGLHELGVEVWGFAASYPESFGVGSFEAQAERIVMRTDEIPEMTGIILDVEMAWFGIPDTHAADLMSKIREYLPAYPLGLSTFRWPSVQGTFPWEGFGASPDTSPPAYFDVVVPQVYWKGSHNPAEQLERSILEYSNLYPGVPFVPAGPAYKEDGWNPGEGEIQEFWNAVLENDLRGASFWDYESSRKNIELWQTVINLETIAMPEPPPEDNLELLREDLNALENKVANIDQAVFDLTNGLDGKIANNKDLIDGLDRATSQLFDNHDERIIENKVQISGLKTRLEVIEEWTREAKSSLVDLESQDELFNKNLSSTIETFGNFKEEANNRFTSLMNKDGKISQRITSEVERLEERIDNIPDCDCEGCNCSDQETGFLNCLKRLLGIG